MKIKEKMFLIKLNKKKGVFMKKKITPLFIILLFCISCVNMDKGNTQVISDKISFNLAVDENDKFLNDSIIGDISKNQKIYCYKPNEWNKLNNAEIFSLVSKNDSTFPKPNYDPEFLIKNKGCVYSNGDKNSYLAIELTYITSNLQALTKVQLDSLVKRTLLEYKNIYQYNLINGFKGSILTDTIVKTNDNAIYSVFEIILKRNDKSYYKRYVSISFINNTKVFASYSSVYKDEKDLVEKSWEAKKLMEKVSLITLKN